MVLVKEIGRTGGVFSGMEIELGVRSWELNFNGNIKILLSFMYDYFCCIFYKIRRVSAMTQPMEKNITVAK